MDATMFQLRTFVHRRMYAAAEEILGEVEKTFSVALFGDEVVRANVKQEAGNLRNKPDCSPISSSVEHRDECESTLLPGLSTPKGSDFSLGAEVPGPSQTSIHLDDNNLSYCLVETDFKVPEIKEEQEEWDVGFPSHQVMKSEQHLLEIHGNHGMEPVSSDVSEAPSENDNEEEENEEEEEGEEEGGEEEKPMRRKRGSGARRRKNPLYSSSPRREKDRSFCHLCGKGFKYIGSLMKHIKTHEKKIYCDLCDITYPNTSRLIMHMKRCHNESFFCDSCGELFPNDRRLRAHLKTHAASNEISCQECGKVFYRREHLVVHVRTHSGEKPYHCDVCGKAFTQSQNLTIHKRSHSGEKPYRCGMCGKLFNTSSHLKTHMRYHSGEKPYPCDVCGKRFRQSGQMTRHRTTHTGERPYGCHICGMTYRFAPNLKVHLQTHEKQPTE